MLEVWKVMSAQRMGIYENTKAILNKLVIGICAKQIDIAVLQ